MFDAIHNHQFQRVTARETDALIDPDRDEHVAAKEAFSDLVDEFPVKLWPPVLLRAVVMVVQTYRLAAGRTIEPGVELRFRKLRVVD